MGLDSITATDKDQLSGTRFADGDITPMTSFHFEAATADGSTDRSASTDGSGDRLQEAAGSVAERVADTAQEKVGTQVDSQLTRAGDMLGQVAGAVRQSGEQLRDEQPQIAGFVDTAAQLVDRASQSLRQTDMQGLAHGGGLWTPPAGRVPGRRQPAARRWTSWVRPSPARVTAWGRQPTRPAGR